MVPTRLWTGDTLFPGWHGDTAGGGTAGSSNGTGGGTAGSSNGTGGGAAGSSNGTGGGAAG
eukprot:11119021-Alexandrium_andersonii.AAC.1